MIRLRSAPLQAFCLEDSMQESIGRDIPCLAHHTCTQPGIQRGWSDYYGADLDCQWIDVTVSKREGHRKRARAAYRQRSVEH